MKYNRPGFAVLPDDSVWYYITMEEDVSHNQVRMFLAPHSDCLNWYNLETGEEMLDVNIDEIDAVFAKFFAKEAGLDWYT